MRTIGLLGGMSWESSAVYYRLLNEGARARLGGLHCASLIMWQVDFAAIEALQRAGKWEEAGAILYEGGRALVAAGAELVGLATNTMHMVAGPMETGLGVPFVHLIDVTARVAQARGARRLGLLGTGFTMASPYFPQRYGSHGLEIVVPDEGARVAVHRIIYEELCQGVVRDESRRAIAAIADGLRDRAAVDAVVLGCTELGLLLAEPGVTKVSLLDTTRLHSEALLDAALA